MDELETEYGTFTDNEVTGQTAQQVYDEWLSKQNQPEPQIKTTEQKLEELMNEYNELKARMDTTETAIMGIMSEI